MSKVESHKNSGNGNNGRRGLVGIGSAVAIALLSVMGWVTTHSDNDHDSTEHEKAAHSASSSRSMGECRVSSLPKEADKQIKDILTGAKPDDGKADGKHFGNYENRLPKQNSNYYREYTVKTPGLNHRGERRIVVGGGTKTDPDVWYYSGDHFKSFCEIPDAEDQKRN